MTTKSRSLSGGLRTLLSALSTLSNDDKMMSKKIYFEENVLKNPNIRHIIILRCSGNKKQVPHVTKEPSALFNSVSCIAEPKNSPVGNFKLLVLTNFCNRLAHCIVRQ